MKTIADIRKIVELYEIYRLYKRVGRELNISHNTVRKYILRLKEVKSGMLNEIRPQNRVIKQPLRAITDEIRKKIHEYLELNLERPRKQRLNVKTQIENFDHYIHFPLPSIPSNQNPF